MKPGRCQLPGWPPKNHCSTIFYQIDVAWFTYWVHAVEYSKPVPGHPNSGQTRGTLSFRSWKRFEKVNNYLFHIILRTSKERGKKVLPSGFWESLSLGIEYRSYVLFSRLVALWNRKRKKLNEQMSLDFTKQTDRVCNTHSAQQHSIFCRIVRHAEHWEFGSTVNIKETIQLKI